MTFWNNFINAIYEQGQDAKFIQHIGMWVLSETDDFTGRNRLSDGIYDTYNQLIEMFYTLRDDFDEFLRQMNEGFDGAVEELLQCDRTLEETAVEEQMIHLEHLLRCEHM